MNKPKIHTDLQSISNFLSENGYQASLQRSEPPLILEQVLVYLDPNGKNKDFVLCIAGMETAENLIGLEKSPNESHVPFKCLQFTLAIPQIITESAMGEVMRYILSINANLDMAHFGLIEKERVMFYRYVYFTPIPSMDGEILIAIIDSIHFMIETFYPLLADVATGKKTYKDLIQESKNMLAKK